MFLKRIEYLSPPIPPLDGLQTVIPDEPSPASNRYSVGSFVIVAVVIAGAAFVAFAIYFLTQYISHRFLRVSSTVADEGNAISSGIAAGTASVENPRGVIVESLPAFTLGGTVSEGGVKDRDCAICLARFGNENRLRLLPICCHVFHADCVDAWLGSNNTCPICRTSVIASELEINKVLREENAVGAGESFRVEIGSVSRRRSTSEGIGDGRRSFSMGSFDYVVDDAFLVAVGRTHRPSVSSDKDETTAMTVSLPHPPGPALAAEVASSQRSWLRDYVDRLASTASSSFRSSGRFFTGSSRRSDVAGIVGDCHTEMETNRIGEEITEMFRWLSGL